MKVVPGLCCAAALVIGVSLATAGQQQSELSASPPVFTPSVGSMDDLRARTPEDRATAKFFERQGSDRLRPGISTSIGGIVQVVPPPGLAPPTYEAFLGEVLCRGDALVVGSARPQRVLLNENETFLFTEYEIAVTRWLFPARQGAARIQLSKEGGRAVVGGRPVEATIGTPLVTGAEYLFMLRRIPDTTGFATAARALNSAEPLRASASQFRLPNEILADAITFERLVEDLSALTSVDCKGRARSVSPSPFDLLSNTPFEACEVSPADISGGAMSGSRRDADSPLRQVEKRRVFPGEGRGRRGPDMVPPRPPAPDLPRRR